MNQLPLLWVSGALVAGIVGSFHKIGFWKAFFAALLLSFPIGIVITLTYKPKKTADSRTEINHYSQNDDSQLGESLEVEEPILVTSELQRIE